MRNAGTAATRATIQKATAANKSDATYAFCICSPCRCTPSLGDSLARNEANACARQQICKIAVAQPCAGRLGLAHTFGRCRRLARSRHVIRFLDADLDFVCPHGSAAAVDGALVRVQSAE